MGDWLNASDSKLQTLGFWCIGRLGVSAVPLIPQLAKELVGGDPCLAPVAALSLLSLSEVALDKVLQAVALICCSCQRAKCRCDADHDLKWLLIQCVAPKD